MFLNFKYLSYICNINHKIMNGILNEEYSRLLANSIDHHESIRHQEKLNLIISEQEMVYVKTFNLVPFKDGNSWCVLLGDDL